MGFRLPRMMEEEEVVVERRVFMGFRLPRMIGVTR
jgi:hypothetical protein